MSDTLSDGTSAPAPRAHAGQLRVTEIFASLQGESRTAGYPTAFVRLTGCPLRCRYCDTPYAFHGGRWMTIDDILAQVRDTGLGYATVTGGEPLAQREALVLLERLCDAGFQVSLETSGAMDISHVDRRVVIVMDLKTPGSGEVHRNRYANIARLAPKDQIKFVICDRADYEWSRERVAEYDLGTRCEVLFSPSHESMNAALLAEWVLADRLAVRLQIQLHKLLWGDEPGR